MPDVSASAGLRRITIKSSQTQDKNCVVFERGEGGGWVAGTGDTMVPIRGPTNKMNFEKVNLQ